MYTVRTSAAVLEEIRTHSLDARITRTRRIALRAEVERREALVERELTSHQGEGDLEHVGNSLSRPFAFAIGTKIVDELLRLRLALAAIENSPAFAEAVEKLDPLFDELAAAEAREQAEREALQKAENALREAREAARLKAEAALAKDASVKAAQAELEALKAKHPQHIVEPEPPRPTALEAYNGEPAPGEPAVLAPTFTP